MSTTRTAVLLLLVLGLASVATASRILLDDDTRPTRPTNQRESPAKGLAEKDESNKTSLAFPKDIEWSKLNETELVCIDAVLNKTLVPFQQCGGKGECLSLRKVSCIE
jgi:hypothetical protein